MKTIFVSSTFRDMQFERDIIHNKITPLLNEKVRDYGESVSFCDLRWGVSTENLSEEESSLKVLSVCLGNIERCRPYFVVILGDRYGFIPNPTMIDEVTQQKNFKLDSKNCSITALEIEFGALCNSDQMKRTLFYFREITGDNIPDIYKAEDSQHAEKLQQLKKKIRTYGGLIKNYTLHWNNEQKNFNGLDNFSDMLVSDIFALMSEEFQEYAQLSEYERDQRIQWEFAKQKSAQFAGRQHLVKNYVEILNSGVNFLVIKGESGSGKSTLMSQLAFNLRNEGYEVLPLFSSLTSNTNDASSIIHYIVEELARKIEYVVKDYEEQIDAIKSGIGIAEKIRNFEFTHQIIFKICRDFFIRFYKFLHKFKIFNRKFNDIECKLRDEIQRGIQLENFEYQKNKARDFRDWEDCLKSGIEIWSLYSKNKFIILLDAVDQILKNKERYSLICCLLELKDQVTTVISCLPTFEIPESIIKRLCDKIKIETVEPLNDRNKIEIINGILKFMGRELSDSVITEILKKVNSENPLYLSLLINRLTMMDKKDFDVINAYGGAISAINSHQIKILHTCSDNLDDLCVDIINTASEKIGSEFVNLAMRYISVSRYGLREADLERILTAKGIHWNSVDFALFVQYLSSFFVRHADGRIDFTHKNIREGCMKLIDDEKSTHYDILEYFKTLGDEIEIYKNELIWHCFKADDKDYFLNYIAGNFKIETGSKNFSLYQECGYISEMCGVDWWRDLLEYGKQEEFQSIRNSLSQFFGQIFNSGEVLFRIFDNGEPFNEDMAKQTLNEYCTYIRLNCREYPDLLIAVYCAIGYFYYNSCSKFNVGDSEFISNRRLAHKFVNKGIAVIKKTYTYLEIRKFIPIKHLNGNEILGISIYREESSPRSKIVRLKADIEGIDLKDIEDYMKELYET